MSKFQIEEHVKKITAYILNNIETDMRLSTHVNNDLGFDSLDHVEWIMEIEKNFNITIPDDIAENILTIEAAVDFIDKKLNY